MITLSAGIGLIELGNSDMAKQEAENERARAGTIPEPEVSTPAAEPEPEPVVEEPVEGSSSDLTPAQSLALVADRDDAEIAALYDRLDAACPENGSRSPTCWSTRRV